MDKVDELISGAMGGAGKMIGGKELFVLEANSERNDLRILTANEAFSQNVTAFAYGITTGYSVLAVFTTREAAEESCGAIRTLFRDEDGNNLLMKKLY
jgi:hypothetical protein